MPTVSANMSLGGVPLLANPEEVRWNFSMKVVEFNTLGGKVIQILGTTVGDITVTGHFGMGRKSLGDEEGWQAELRMRDQVKNWAEEARTTSNKSPIPFAYAPRNWNFQVFVKSISPISHTVEEINPIWQLVLVPIDEVGLEIQRGIRDAYIKRLMDGIGWKRTDYNGPSQSEVDGLLGGLSFEQYEAQGMGEAFMQGTQGQPFTPSAGQAAAPFQPDPVVQPDPAGGHPAPGEGTTTP